MQLHLGDSLEVLKSLPENSIDSIVTDPPYFLLNASGKGFMGKEWDSLSRENVVVESLLKSMNLVLDTDEESTAQEHANIQKKESHVLFVHQQLNRQQQDSAHLLVLTKQEVLVLCKELLPSHTKHVEKLSSCVKFVLHNSDIEISTPKNTVQNIVSIWQEEPKWLEQITTFTSTDNQNKTSLVTEDLNGTGSENKSTNETIGPVNDVIKNVEDSTSNVITSYHLEFQEVMKKITSSPYAKAVTKQFTSVPNAMSILSAAFHERWARECLRVIKPGGHALVASLPRVQHQMAVGLEAAGFEIRDCLAHLFGSGFPKNHNLGGGFGTALKPSREDWILARKPISESTVAKNFEKWGTGGINIDECRIEGKPRTTHADGNIQGTAPQPMSWGQSNNYVSNGSEGRWPANTLFDEEAAQMLDEQTGILKSGGGNKGNNPGSKAIFGRDNGNGFDAEYESSQGGASRFFYCAKASKSERNNGCEGLPEVKLQDFAEGTKRKLVAQAESPKNPNLPRQNFHPTVKPLKLMQYLIKLITPPNGTVLDPFMGSGSTGVAAKQLGFEFVGIEREPEYFEIAKRRIE